VDSSSNLHLSMYRSLGSLAPFRGLHASLLAGVVWHRVKYRSVRYGSECETPCWTNFYGGVSAAPPNPHQPVPAFLQPLLERVSALCKTPFNALLVRLYYDGTDNIAWHTDGRKFLGKEPTIASLSLGASAGFEMRRMTDVWPCAGGASAGGASGDGIDRSTPGLSVKCGHGDLLVMRGDTQDHWHHRVAKEKGRRPRVNINFRYIEPGTGVVATEGQETY
jgi:alkylated DNA repair dioxygenase AlkB